MVVVGQLALSVPLLVGAGLLVRTLFNLQQVDLGYNRDGLATVRVDARAAGYEPARQAAAFGDMLARIRELPSVRAATYSNNGLFGGADNGDRIAVEGYTPTGDGDGGSAYDAVGPAYFSTLGIPVVLGREISEQDLAAGRMVALINERFAERFFANRNPLGLHITQMYADDRHTYEIIGVVRNSRQNRLRGEIEHRFYAPITQPAAFGERRLVPHSPARRRGACACRGARGASACRAEHADHARQDGDHCGERQSRTGSSARATLSGVRHRGRAAGRDRPLWCAAPTASHGGRTRSPCARRWVHSMEC